MKLVIVAAIACACGKKELPPANEFEAFERRFVADMQFLADRMREQGKDVPDDQVPTSFRAVFIGPSGIYVDRTRVATLAELDGKRPQILAALDANAKLLPTIHESPSVTFALDSEPASVAVAVLRLLAGRKLAMNQRYENPEIPMKSTQSLCGETTVRDTPSTDRSQTQISVLLDKDKIWIGKSIINEFYVIKDLATKEHDFENMKWTLLNEKRATFEGRTDVELGAIAGTSRDVLAAFELACSVGFYDIAVLPKDQLSAVPAL
jgi:hypothetical protein